MGNPEKDFGQEIRGAVLVSTNQGEGSLKKARVGAWPQCQEVRNQKPVSRVTLGEPLGRAVKPRR